MSDDSTKQTSRGTADNGDVARTAAERDDRILEVATSLYRDEMRRTVAWRNRLDRTSNWTVVLTATLLTWSFSQADNPHYVLLAAVIMVCFFLFAEARRYRYYDVWRSRLRLLEQNVFANVFDPQGTEQDDWRRLLSKDLRDPSFRMPWIEAIRRRLRRFYGAILWLLLGAWALRVTAFTDGRFDPSAAAIGDLPGTIVLVAVGLFAAAVSAAMLWPLERQASGKVGDDEGEARSWDD